VAALFTDRDGEPEALTVIATSSNVISTPSLAVNRRTYVPARLKPAVVLRAFAFAKLTVPGPLTFVHEVVSAAGGFGNPSSEAEPLSDAVAGRTMT
jgi:hypothetical protein